MILILSTLGYNAITAGFLLIWIGALVQPRRNVPRLRSHPLAYGILAALIRTMTAIIYARYSELNELHPRIKLHTNEIYLYFCSPVMGFIAGFAWSYVFLKYSQISKPAIFVIVALAALLDFLLILPITN